MTFYKARKVSMGYYLLAAVLLLLGVLLFPAGTWRYLLYAGALVFALLGYRMASKYSRCPKCGHVLQVGLYRIHQCNFCDYPIDEKTVYKF